MCKRQECLCSAVNSVAIHALTDERAVHIRTRRGQRAYRAKFGNSAMKQHHSHPAVQPCSLQRYTPTAAALRCVAVLCGGVWDAVRARATLLFPCYLCRVLCGVLPSFPSLPAPLFPRLLHGGSAAILHPAPRKTCALFTAVCTAVSTAHALRRCSDRAWPRQASAPVYYNSLKRQEGAGVRGYCQTHIHNGLTHITVRCVNCAAYSCPVYLVF